MFQKNIGSVLFNQKLDKLYHSQFIYICTAKFPPMSYSPQYTVLRQVQKISIYQHNE